MLILYSVHKSMLYISNTQKAEDIAQVLSNLSNNTSGNSLATVLEKQLKEQFRSNSSKTIPETTLETENPHPGESNNNSSAVAAFDSGIRITHDENTNSLVIIATPDQIQYVKQVIEKLDIRRKQVFVEAVVLIGE